MAKDQNQSPDTQEEEYKGILGDYTEQEEPDASALSETKSDAPKKNNILKTAGIAVISAAIFACLAAMSGCFSNGQNASDESGTASQVQESQENTGNEETSETVNTIEDDSIAMASENITVSPAVMECFYQDFLSEYISLLSYYGVDTSASLKDQMLPEDSGENMSWFAYFMNQAQGAARQIIVFNEAANAAGYTLTAEDEQTIEEELAAIDMTNYSENVTEEDVHTMLKMRTLASSYFNQVLEGIEISDQDYEDYYQENQNSFDTAGVMGFTVSYDDPNATEETDADSEPGMTQEQAKEFADKLLASASPEEFETLTAEILRTYEGYSDEELETIHDSITNQSYSYAEGSELSEWVFSDGLQVNATTMIEGDNKYSVYMLLRQPSRDDTDTVNIRHILFATDNHTEELADDADDAAVSAAQEAALAECWKLAEETLAEWESGDKTEDSFAALATEKTEDPGSQTTGGLYENVYPGQMVTTFNDWCFEETRQPGDTGLVETNYGVHVMYFSGTSDPIWKTTAKQAIQSDRINAWYDEQDAAWPVSVNQDAIDNIEG